MDGDWVVRKHCVSRSQTLGAICPDSFSKKVTLVVHGELAGNVKDTDRGLSQKLLAVMKSRREGRHLHVVDAAGYSDLLFGAPARCRSLKMQGEQVAVVAEVGEGVLGGPFDLIRLRTRTAVTAWAGAFGHGTPSHQRLLSEPIGQVSGNPSMEARDPARRGPQFDVGWVSGQTAYGAWAASPQHGVGSGQHRFEDAILHVGRAVRAIRTLGPFQPVVVVDRSVDLASSRLDQVAKSAGIALSGVADLGGDAGRTDRASTAGW
ncbi:hypothetical protein [Kitasatospora indigofera]|uniref:hypothetical protein n=1 Tax=Kitasatospora indigofera TaxID=67307 RepID=UPI00368BC7CD